MGELDVPSFVCPRCAHEAPFLGDVSTMIIRCSECAAKIAYGVLQPRTVVQPSGRFISITVDGGPPIVLCHDAAIAFARDILSIARAGT